jgi:hypothetical protein
MQTLILLYYYTVLLYYYTTTTNGTLSVVERQTAECDKRGRRAVTFCAGPMTLGMRVLLAHIEGVETACRSGSRQSQLHAMHVWRWHPPHRCVASAPQL